jgi:tetratricopeptide (TPR) repeat protein
VPTATGRSDAQGQLLGPYGPRARQSFGAPRALLGLGALLGLSLVLGACQAAGPELQPIPEPDLSKLSESAQLQLREQRGLLDEAVAEGSVQGAQLAQIYGDLARHYHAYELVSAAEPAYANAQILAPEAFAWPYLMGHMYRVEGNLPAAAAEFRKAIALDPQAVTAPRWLAEVLLDADDLEGAEAALNAALALDPEAAPTLVTAAKLSALRGDHARTVELLEKVRARMPAATEVNYPLGQAYRQLGDMDAAERYLAQAGGVKASFDDPLLDGLDSLIQSAGAAINRGAKALSQGRLDVAEREFRKAMELEPDNPSGHLNLGYVLAQKGDVAGALRALERAIALDPDDARANFNLASMLVRTGRGEDSLPYFEHALEIDPAYVDAHFNLANNLQRLDRIEEAVQHYARVLELDPGNRSAHLMLGVDLTRLERWPEALAALEAGHAAVPEEPMLANTLARVLATCPDPDLRNPERARTLAEGLLAREPALAHVEALAMALAAQGRFTEAAAEQQRALEAAASAGNPALVESVQLNLSRYEAGQPAAGPWTPQDPSMPRVR